ncbi:hypothetical protein EZS27_024411 [termite gut metagenome]|uniref:DNA pilot protein n=1 Tax=termite gut metagenome TaxID=433724 RepID=A0A5J4QXE7_9ZZZZ
MSSGIEDSVSSPSVGYSLIPALVSTGGSIYSAERNYQSQKEANKTNLELAKAQREFDQLMWEQNNEYNLPANQMARLEAAGLNKNLIYGKITDNVAAPAPQGETGHVDAFKGHNLGLNEGVATFLQSRMQGAVLENMLEQNKNLREQNGLIQSQTAVQNQAAVESGLRQAGMLSANKSSAVAANYAEKLAEQSYQVGQLNMLHVAKDIESKSVGIDVSRQQLVNMMTQNQLQQFELGLRKFGISQNDPIPVRLAAALARNLFGDDNVVVHEIEKIFSPNYEPKQ